ncbi:MAG: hypothetical protein JWP91_2237 [Fibrobacteres bacterium]|nr:hypothetical protein [Fibrobacterota bacterium]
MNIVTEDGFGQGGKPPRRSGPQAGPAWKRIRMVDNQKKYAILAIQYQSLGVEVATS